MRRTPVKKMVVLVLFSFSLILGGCKSILPDTITAKTEEQFVVTPSLDGQIPPRYENMSISELRALFGGSSYQENPVLLWDYSYLEKEILQKSDGEVTPQIKRKLEEKRDLLANQTLFTVKLQSKSRERVQADPYRFLMEDDQGNQYTVSYLNESGVDTIVFEDKVLYYNYLTVGFEYQITAKSDYVRLYIWEGQVLTRIITWRFAF